MKRFAIVPVLLAGLAGCGSVASPDYQGEPVATFRGYVLWQKPEPLVPVDLVMFWTDYVNSVDRQPIRQIAVRQPLRSEAPARFEFSIFEPPPEDAYYDRTPPAGWSFSGPRAAEAHFALVEKGALPASEVDKSVVAKLDHYSVRYVEADGATRITGPDGSSVEGHVTKGFHLVRQEPHYCADGFDQACIEEQMTRWHQDEAHARWSCMIGGWAITNPVEVPLDTELAFKVVDPNAPFEVPTNIEVPCPKR